MPLRAIDSKNTVAILLGYYHGDKYILQQLRSIFSQTPPVKIFISDDGEGSKLKQLVKNLPGRDNISLLKGPKGGFARNFLSLITNPDIEAKFYAFADQDDIWEPDKLERALNWLKTVPNDIPACYCSRTTLIDEEENIIGLSPLFTRKPSFENALVQSIACGNTMVMNKAARDLLMKNKDIKIVSHDWWTYMLVTGAGGQFYYDPHPSILYRQHGTNTVGCDDSLIAKFARVLNMLKGSVKQWNDINIEALQACKDLLTPENQRILDIFSQARQKSFIARMLMTIKAGVYRQTFLGNLSLYLAACLKRV